MNWIGYDPFGVLIDASGESADENPFRFSTKYTDESGLVYYGYRYYSAELGRWASRDPIEERGSLSLYLFGLNNPVSITDLLGLFDMTIIVGPSITKPVDEPNNVWKGKAKPLWGRVSTDHGLRIGYSEFKKDKLRNPDGVDCNLDIDYIISSYDDPVMTLDNLRAQIATKAPSLGVPVFLSHGIQSPQGVGNAKHPLVTKVVRTPTKPGVVHDGKVLGKLYSLTEIFGSVTAEGKDLPKLVVGCCHSRFVDREEMETDVQLLAPPNMSAGKVTWFDVQPRFVALVRTLCCRKLRSGAPTTGGGSK